MYMPADPGLCEYRPKSGGMCGSTARYTMDVPIHQQRQQVGMFGNGSFRCGKHRQSAGYRACQCGRAFYKIMNRKQQCQHCTVLEFRRRNYRENKRESVARRVHEVLESKEFCASEAQKTLLLQALSAPHLQRRPAGEVHVLGNSFISAASIGGDNRVSMPLGDEVSL